MDIRVPQVANLLSALVQLQIIVSVTYSYLVNAWNFWLILTYQEPSIMQFKLYSIPKFKSQMS